MVGPVADTLVDRQQQQAPPPPPQQQYPQPMYQPAMPPRRGQRQPIDFGDFGVPPVLADSAGNAAGHDDDFIAKSRELQQQHIREMREQAAMQKQQHQMMLQQRLAEEKRQKQQQQTPSEPLSVDEMLRSFMDDVVDKGASGGGSGSGGGRFEEVIEDNDDEPLNVSVEHKGRGRKR